MGENRCPASDRRGQSGSEGTAGGHRHRRIRRLVLRQSPLPARARRTRSDSRIGPARVVPHVPADRRARPASPGRPSVACAGRQGPRARSTGGGTLTSAELRIARLLQQGMRNREIAAALHYSPRSIEVYLSRIYGKLRVSSRLALARMLDTIDRGQ
ncbi:MAG TPA: helix-turn-helix transcriptional regulator [Pseudonocardiaceae bacterium]|nr:helix-turn-helix transcriptional regulator [Pseudonocardiaceae bacterium]